MIDHCSRPLPCQAISSRTTKLKFIFVGYLPDTFLTLSDIQHRGVVLQLELQDRWMSKVHTGPGAYVKAEIVILNRDFKVNGEDE